MLLLKTLEKAISCLITTACICFISFMVSALVCAIGGPFIICLLFVLLLYYKKHISFYLKDRKVQKELNRMEKHIRNNK